MPHGRAEGLTDAQWMLLAPLIPEPPRRPIGAPILLTVKRFANIIRMTNSKPQQDVYFVKDLP